MKKFLIAALFLLLSCRVLAQEAEVKGNEEIIEGVELPLIIITPTKYETSIRGIPSSFSVIYEDEILSKGKPQVKDILKSVPGLNIVQTGSFGSATSIFTRGTESSHTLVMMDGVKIYDPSSTNGAFNFANLTLDNVERVEVLRGPYSTLYGSDAIGGVVNIITKKGKGKPKVWASFEGGSYLTFKEAVGSDGEIYGLHYSGAFARLDTEGISKADSKLNNDEKDGYNNTSISLRMDYEPFDAVTVGSTFRYTDAEIEIDDGGGSGADDPNRRNIERQTVISSYINFDMTDWWSVNLKWLWMNNERLDKDQKDDINPTDYLNSNFKGRNVSYELYNVFKTGKFGTLSGGIDYDKQRSDSFSDSLGVFGRTITDPPRVKNHNIGYYLQEKLDIGDDFHAIAGFRIDDHSDFGLHGTYKISGKYTFDTIFDTKTFAKGSWATGFKAPSLFQLHDPSNGNSALKPEESESFEAGLGQELFGGRLNLESTYFSTKLDNLIDWVLVSMSPFFGQYQNVNKAKIHGIENMVVMEPLDHVKLKYSYTYLKTENEATDQSLNRRPRHKHVLGLELKPLENLDFNISYIYTGNRKDIRFVGGSATQIILKAYHKIDLSGRYIVNDNFEVFGRVENLLDKHYQEVDGYGTPGISFYAGGKVTY